jgi:hypothetical protein
MKLYYNVNTKELGQFLDWDVPGYPWIRFEISDPIPEKRPPWWFTFVKITVLPLLFGIAVGVFFAALNTPWHIALVIGFVVSCWVAWFLGMA